MREFSVNIDTSVLDEAFKQAPNMLIGHLKVGVSEAGQLLSKAAREEAPKGYSTLTKKLKSHVVGELQRMITSSMNYNGFVVGQTGKQGMPPMQSILDWVKVKRLNPRNPKHSQSDLAFMIARSISRNGTAANDFYDRAAEAKAEKVAEILNASVVAGLKAAGLRSQ